VDHYGAIGKAFREQMARSLVAVSCDMLTNLMLTDLMLTDLMLTDLGEIYGGA
jgi:hypothetical protein